LIISALKKELRRFGLKVIPRRKAIPILKHIFTETHPGCLLIFFFNFITKSECKKFSVCDVGDAETNSQSLSQNSDDVEDDNNDFPEETLVEDIVRSRLKSSLTKLNYSSCTQICSQAPSNDPVELGKEIVKFIKNDPTLNRQCLMFEPIWLEDFYSDFKKV